MGVSGESNAIKVCLMSDTFTYVYILYSSRISVNMCVCVCVCIITSYVRCGNSEVNVDSYTL